MELTEAGKRIQHLREELDKYNHQYYMLSKSLISDLEYDLMMKELEKLESEYPEFFDANSPSQRVGNDINLEFSLRR